MVLLNLKSAEADTLTLRVSDNFPVFSSVFLSEQQKCFPKKHSFHYFRILCIFVLIFSTGCRNSFFIRAQNLSGIWLNYINWTPVVELKAEPAEKGIAPPVHLRFLLDTGSNTTLLRKDFIPGVEKQVYSSFTTHGKTELELHPYEVRLSSPDEQEIFKGTVNLIKFEENLPFDGILGNDVLSHYILVLDHFYGAFLEKRQILKKNWFRQMKKIQLNANAPRHLMVSALAGKNLERMDMLIDTGANHTYLGSETAENLKLKLIDKKPYTDIRGVEQEGKIFRLENLCIEKFCKKEYPVLSGSSLRGFLGEDGIPVAGLIGYDWMREHVIAVDYLLHEVYIR